MKNKYPLLLLGTLCVLNAAAQLNVTVDSNALRLARIIAGPGFTVSNAGFIGNYGASGTFGGNTNMGIDTGVIFTSGLAQSAEGPNDSVVTYSWFTEGDPDLAAAIGDSSYNIWDPCGIEFDILVPGNCLNFNYVFASEEYPDWTCTQYNDVFGIFISGPGISGKQDIALLPGTNIPVSVNNVNDGPGIYAVTCPPDNYPQYFINNGTFDSTGIDSFASPNDSLPYYIQYNGFTVQLNAGIAGLQPNSIYHVKMVIADDGDTVLDSGIFIQAGYLSSNTHVANNIVPGTPYSTVNPLSNVAVAGCSNGVIPVRALVPDTVSTTVYFQIGGTAINGTDYTLVTDSITFNAGDTLHNVIIQPINTGQSGTKTVILLFAAACGGTVADTLYLMNTPQAQVTSSQTTICPGDTARICASQGFANYNWNTGDTTLCINTTYAGNYYVTVSNNGQCSAISNTINLTVYQPSPVTVSVSGDTLTGYTASGVINGF